MKRIECGDLLVFEELPGCLECGLAINWKMEDAIKVWLIMFADGTLVRVYDEYLKGITKTVQRA